MLDRNNFSVKGCYEELLASRTYAVTRKTSLMRRRGRGKETSFKMCINNVVCFVLKKLKLKLYIC